MTSQYELRIPKDRIAVLIGIKGEVKRRLEKLTGCWIKVNSKEGDVVIDGEDSIRAFVLVSVVKAIGRGFNPEVAEELLNDEEYSLEIIEMKGYSGKSKNKEQRLKGRVIGEKGKARQYLEELTDTKICVYGKTIAVIGEIEKVSIAKRAIEDLLRGSPHGPTYKKCYEKMKDIQKS